MYRLGMSIFTGTSPILTTVLYRMGVRASKPILAWVEARVSLHQFVCIFYLSVKSELS